MKCAGRITFFCVLIFLCILPAFALDSAQTQEKAVMPPVLRLTEEEKQFLSTYPALNVVCEKNNAPFSYRSDEDDFFCYRGISVSLLELASLKLGIDLQMLPTASDKESVSLFEKNQADIATWTHFKGDFCKSAPLFSVDLYLISRTNEKSASVRGKKRLLVAMPKEKAQNLYLTFHTY